MADFKNVLLSIEKNLKKINNKNEISEDETERKKLLKRSDFYLFNVF